MTAIVNYISGLFINLPIVNHYVCASVKPPWVAILFCVFFGISGLFYPEVLYMMLAGRDYKEPENYEIILLRIIGIIALIFAVKLFFSYYI